MINLRNALMAGKPLPYDSETEYLQATGPQWIDTGVVPTASTKIEASWKQVEASTTQQRLYGVRENRVYFDIFVKNGKWQGRFFSTTSVATATVTAGEVYTLAADAAAGKITVNGVTASTGTTPATTFTGTIPIFARRVDGEVSTSYESKMQLYSLKIYVNGVLVRDFIPVRKGTVGYLYDRVSGKLFGNAGTGDFVLGQDVVPMTWQDGLQYNNVGTPVESATSSIGLDYIPITAGHTFTWRLGYGSSASADLIIYNANKERIDYWVARDRTVTISGAAAYMRISALTSYKEQATVYDETAQKYVFANGRIPTATT